MADKVITAEQGATYGIGIGSHGLGVLHPQGQTAQDCIACVKDGATLTFFGIPPEIQLQYGLGEREVVTFMETRDDAHDYVRFSSGEDLPFCCFANHGITAYVGVLTPDAKPVVKEKVRELVDA